MKQELSPAIEDYLRFRRSQEYSKSTMKADMQVLKRFLATNGNIWVHSINERHVERHMEGARLTRQATSLKNDHGVLVRFFKWARHTGRMPVETDPMFGRRQPKAIKRERNRIPVHDFPRLLDAAEKRDPRDRALIAVLLYTLMRDGEITDLRVRDYDPQGLWLTARIHKSKLEDRIPVSLELAEEMNRWLRYYSTAVGGLAPGYLLIPARGVHPIHNAQGRIEKHLSFYKPEKQIRAGGRIITPILEQIGFPVVDENGKKCGEGSHTIRRSGARALFDQLVGSGYDHALRIVQSLLHHSSMQMTEHYLGITADRRSRDDILRGKQMYTVTEDNVVQLAR